MKSYVRYVPLRGARAKRREDGGTGGSQNIVSKCTGLQILFLWSLCSIVSLNSIFIHVYLFYSIVPGCTSSQKKAEKVIQAVRVARENKQVTTR